MMVVLVISLKLVLFTSAAETVFVDLTVAIL
jgi:hypothetical protein